jgi:hypothetical protein
MFHFPGNFVRTQIHCEPALRVAFLNVWFATQIALSRSLNNDLHDCFTKVNKFEEHYISLQTHDTPHYNFSKTLSPSGRGVAWVGGKINILNEIN